MPDEMLEEFRCLGLVIYVAPGRQGAHLGCRNNNTSLRSDFLKKVEKSAAIYQLSRLVGCEMNHTWCRSPCTLIPGPGDRN